MDWFQPLDQYCERTAPLFWAEPLNAISNAAFVFAALALLLAWRRSPGRNAIGLLLALNVLVIGIGSFLFHTFANRWSALADVLPITVFIFLYLAVALRTFLDLRWQATGLAVAGFAVATPLVSAGLAPLAGSTAGYATALAAIFAVGFAARSLRPTVTGRLFIAGAVFPVSCLLRALDLPLCDVNAAGTHMLWHILNAVTLYLLVRAYLVITATPGAR